MDIICKQENLAKGLNTALRAVPSRGALPVTTHLLLETDDGMLKVTGTDLANVIATWVPCTVIAEGALTVPAKLLTEYIGAISDDEVELLREGEGALLKVNAGRSRTHINGGMPAEFPPPPTLDDEDDDTVTINVKTQALKNAIQRVAMAAATEESRPVLTGVQIKISDRKLPLAAADGFRLAVHTEDLGDDLDADTSVEFIIPAKSLTELQRLLTSADDTVVITAGTKKNCAIFRIAAPERTEFTTILLQGTFPNWDSLIPQDHQSEITVDSQAFLRTVRTAAIFAKDGSNIIRLNYGHNAAGIPQLNVSANSEELGQYLDELPLTEAKGQNGRIAFNHRFLQEAITSTGPGLITLQTSNPSSPGVLRPHGSQSTIHVIMPMFVQWDHYEDGFEGQAPGHTPLDTGPEVTLLGDEDQGDIPGDTEPEDNAPGDADNASRTDDDDDAVAAHSAAGADQDSGESQEDEAENPEEQDSESNEEFHTASLAYDDEEEFQGEDAPLEPVTVNPFC